MKHIAVNPKLTRWAHGHARLEQPEFAVRFKKLSEWHAYETRPTLQQVERLARAVLVPVGYLFLGKPTREVTALETPAVKRIDPWLGHAERAQVQFVSCNNSVVTRRRHT